MENTKQSSCPPAGKRGWLTARNVLFGALAIGGAAGLFFGWNWLVAAGLASIVVGILPCLAMCALGLCMNRMGKNDASSAGASVRAGAAQAPEKPAGEHHVHVRRPARS